MPDLRQLRAFVAVAEDLSFTRAAERLHLAQQSVSKTVRELERELGVELLERTTRDVRVTPAGDALLTAGRDVLRAADAAFARAREVGAGVSGTVHVGITPPVGPTDQADVIAALRAAGPDVSVSLRELRPGDLRRALRAGEVDLVLSRTAGADDPAVAHAELRPTPVALCVPEGHRLAGGRRDAAVEEDGARPSTGDEAPAGDEAAGDEDVDAGALPLRAIDGERLMTASGAGTPYTDLLVARCVAAGATVTVVEARVTGGSAILTQLAAHDAVALAPAGTVPPPGVVVRPVEDTTVPLLLLWPAGRPSPAVRRVREALGTR